MQALTLAPLLLLPAVATSRQPTRSYSWSNVTLFNIVPTDLLSLTPTSTADQWLADPFNAAYYDIRGRYGPMACRSPIARGSEFCSEALEVEPRA
eukprot:COSAG04_NODE_858_length_9827_cov_4.159025_1_plen_95_part_00